MMKCLSLWVRMVPCEIQFEPVTVGVDMTLEQVLNAARQLAEEERIELACRLFGPLESDGVDREVEQIRSQFEMPAPMQRRMSVLAAKCRDRTIQPSERQELDRLVDDFRDRALALARAAAARAAGRGG